MRTNHLQTLGLDTLCDCRAQGRHRGRRHARDVDTPGANDVDTTFLFEPIGLHAVETAVGKHALLPAQETKVSVRVSCLHARDEHVPHFRNTVPHGVDFCVPFRSQRRIVEHRGNGRGPVAWRVAIVAADRLSELA